LQIRGRVGFAWGLAGPVQKAAVDPAAVENAGRVEFGLQALVNRGPTVILEAQIGLHSQHRNVIISYE
jgi:hypothetical protein